MEHDAKVDTNDKWFNNPQYRFTVKKKTQIYISLMQEDERKTGKQYKAVNFLVARTKQKKDTRLWELNKQDVVLEAVPDGALVAKREITKVTSFSPIYEKSHVNYIIVPNTVGDLKNAERPFFLRIFSSEPIELVQLPPTIEKSHNGRWIKETVGAKRIFDNGQENIKWCNNPQYYLNVTQATHLKIILRRKKQQKCKNNIGLTLTKAKNPDEKPAA